MGDTSVKKVDSEHSPKGRLGQRYLASGKTVSMRLWEETNSEQKEQNVARDYETVGYVLAGTAQLEIEGQTIKLEEGDSWMVPKGAKHTYRIHGHFKAIEATSPPAQVHSRDE
jgi:quercetin dioxygenase-like cupin family protein